MVLILILVVSNVFSARLKPEWFKISMDLHSIFSTTRYFYSSDNSKYHRLISFKDTFDYKEFEMEIINDNTVV